MSSSRNLLKRLLAKEGVAAETAKNGSVALTMTLLNALTAYDIIFVDNLSHVNMVSTLT